MSVKIAKIKIRFHSDNITAQVVASRLANGSMIVRVPMAQSASDQVAKKTLERPWHNGERSSHEQESLSVFNFFETFSRQTNNFQ